MSLDAHHLAALCDLYRALSGDTPAWMALRDMEVERGYWPIPVGSVPWFRAKDWHEHDCVSLDGDEVRIVAISARRPHRGAFKRLLKSLRYYGLKPVIIAPLDEMEAIMRKWGWQAVRVGHDFATFETQWRPPS